MSPDASEDAVPAGDSRADTEVRSSVRSLEKALDLLDFLARTGAPAGVRAIEAATGIPKATAQRLLDALERRYFVRKQGGKYALWVGSVYLARAFLQEDGLSKAAMPVLKALTELSDETSSLYVRSGKGRILLERVESPHPLRFQTTVGEFLPLHLGASGTVLCSGLDDAELDALLEDVVPVKLANGAELSKDDIMQRISDVRRKGYAVGVSERYEGITSIAAPVFDGAGKVLAAINVVGPSYRMTQDKVDRLMIEVRGAARELTRVLRW